MHTPQPCPKALTTVSKIEFGIGKESNGEK